MSAGGTQTLSLAAGPANGGAFYYVLGSASGTSPGAPIGSILLPLNFDAYFNFTLLNPNVPPLGSTFANLDGEGAGTATITIAPGTDPSLAGATFHHAFGTFTLTGGLVTVLGKSLREIREEEEAEISGEEETA